MDPYESCMIINTLCPLKLQNLSLGLLQLKRKRASRSGSPFCCPRLRANPSCAPACYPTLEFPAPAPLSVFIQTDLVYVTGWYDPTQERKRGCCLHWVYICSLAPAYQLLFLYAAFHICSDQLSLLHWPIWSWPGVIEVLLTPWLKSLSILWLQCELIPHHNEGRPWRIFAKGGFTIESNFGWPLHLEPYYIMVRSCLPEIVMKKSVSK